IANLRGKVSREIYYAHTQLELFSTTVLKEVGIIPMLDALERTGQTRPIIIIGATEDDPEELFKVPLPIETINVLGLRSHITITSREKAGTTIEKARMFLNKLTSPGIEPVAVKLSLLEEGGGEAPESEPGPGSKAPVRITGKMIFRGDKLVGDFDLRETRGCNWIIDEVTRANLDFTYPGREDTSVSVINSHNFSTFKPVMTEEGPKIDLKVKATGSIVNITGLSDIKAESELTQSLEKRMATVIQNDIERALDKAQKLKSDVFGFGNAFYRQEYQSWLEMEDDWPDIFADLPVDIEVEAVIKNTGLINRGIQSR
ncbi:MAG: Ger(x)C family spore germination protein, partial [Halanaerobiales bacterium]